MKNILAKLLAISLCILSFTSHVYAQCFIDNSHWTLITHEEFKTSVADLQTRWKFSIGSDNPTPNWYEPLGDPNNIHIDNSGDGLIYFETKKLPTPIIANGHRYLYSAGDMQSLFDDIPICNNFSNTGYLYGMFEIRCKLPKQKGQYTAFWMHSLTGPEREIDVFEQNATYHDYFFSTIHFLDSNSNKQECGNSYYYPFDIADDFHTWTLVWTPARMTWFFDGRELKTDDVSSHVPGATAPNMIERCKYMKMITQTGAGLNYPDSTQTAPLDPFIVDYIRVYKPNGYQPYTGNGGADFDTWHDDQKTLYANTPYKTSSDWNLDRLITNESYNSLAGLNVVQGGGKYIYKGDGNLLWNTYWNGSRFASFPLNGSVTIDDDISVAAPLELPFFRQGSKLGYYQNGIINYVKLNNRALVNNVQSTILANPNGLQVIYLGDDGNLWESNRTSLTTNAWLTNQITYSGNASKEVIFGSNSYDIIYYADWFGNLVILTFDGHSWNEVLASTVGDISSSLAINSNKDKIYYRNLANNLLYYYYANGTWSQQPIYAITPYSSGQVVLIDNVASNICLDNDKPFYIGTDGRVWNIYQNGNNWYAAPLSWTLTYARRNLQVLNSRVYFVGNDGQIRSFFNGVCEVLNPACDHNTYSRNQATGVSQTALSTATASPSSAGYFTVYPNPAKTDIQIEFSFSPQPNTVLTIINAVGQIVREIHPKDRLLRLPIVDLSNGIYVIKLQSHDGVFISKFAKEY